MRLAARESDGGRGQARLAARLYDRCYVSFPSAAAAAKTTANILSPNPLFEIILLLGDTRFESSGWKDEPIPSKETLVVLPSYTYKYIDRFEKALREKEIPFTLTR